MYVPEGLCLFRNKIEPVEYGLRMDTRQSQLDKGAQHVCHQP